MHRLLFMIYYYVVHESAQYYVVHIHMHESAQVLFQAASSFSNRRNYVVACLVCKDIHINT